VWVNDSDPPLSADNLNKIEQGVVDAHIHMSTKNNPHSVTAEQIGAATEADLNAHIDDKDNPHSVTAEQIGAATEADLNAHIDDKDNPHSVTAEQIGAATEADLNAHVDDKDNPHSVTAEQIGAATEMDLNAHIDDKNNPHSVTAEQIGAATEMDLITHIADSGNPHQVTAEQVGSPTMAEFAHHTDDKTNPHQVTAEQVGSPTTAEFAHHTDDKTNPHEVTHDQTNPEGVDLTDDDVERNKHISNDDGKRWNDHVNHPHPHSNHETPAGAQAKVNAHAERTDNPHNVTAAQIGAIDITVLTAHEENATLHLTPELRAALDYSEYPPTGENPVVTTIELHNAMAGSVKSAVGTVAELSAIPPTQRRDRDMRLVEEEGKIYRFDAEAIEGDIPPDEGSGYWIAVASATQSHNNLSGMQGGDANLVQYYHLSHDEYIAVTTHHERLDNPHEVTAEQVGAVAAINGIAALGGHLSIWQQGEDLETVNNPESGTILLINNHNGLKNNPHEVTHDQVDPMPVEYGPDETRDKHLSNHDFAVLIDHLYTPGAHGSTRVESSEDNGSILIDGVKTTVYTHPPTHPASMITGLHPSATTGVAGSVTWDNVTGKPSTFTPSEHTHEELMPKTGGTFTGEVNMSSQNRIMLGGKFYIRHNSAQNALEIGVLP
jgi:hypothetical protein